MGANTDIEYCQHSFSPWWGCAHKSTGCLNCFAETWSARWGNDLWHAHGPRRIVSKQQWAQPRRWNELARQSGKRHRVLCGTMCDVFEQHPQVGEARRRLFALIEETPWLIWMLFTKRPENVNDMVPWGGSWPANVWLVPSVENQQMAEERIGFLAATAAPVKALSCEPMLSRLDLTPWLASLIDWVIIGGESGAAARPAYPAWVSDLISQCRTSQTPVWFKQWGEYGPAPWWVGQQAGETRAEYRARARATAATHLYPQPAGLGRPQLIPAEHPAWSDRRGDLPAFSAPMRRYGKNKAGHLIDGQRVTELPAAAHWTPSVTAA